jgi:hypothetical protein
MGCGEILAEKICVVLIIDLSFDDNYVFVGTRSREDAESLLRLVQDDPLSVWTRDTQIVDLAQCYVSGEPRRFDGEPLLSRFVCWRVAMWRAYNYPHRIRPFGLRPPTSRPHRDTRYSLRVQFSARTLGTGSRANTNETC